MKHELREGSLDLAFTPVLDTKMRGHGRGLTSERARISGAGSRVASEFV